MAPKITVYWLNHSRAQRILWLLEELDLPYEIQKFERTKELLAPKEMLDVHPLGKSPVVTIEDEGQTITLAESGAITEYLIEKYGHKLEVSASAGFQERATYLYWLHWAEGSAMQPLIFSIVFAQMPKQAPWVARPLVSFIASQVMNQFVRPNLKKNFNFVEAELAGKDFFVANKLTGADIMMYFVAEGLEPALGFEKFPNIKAWYDKMAARPAYKRAVEKGGVNDMTVFL